MEPAGSTINNGTSLTSNLDSVQGAPSPPRILPILNCLNTSLKMLSNSFSILGERIGWGFSKVGQGFQFLGQGVDGSGAVLVSIGTYWRIGGRLLTNMGTVMVSSGTQINVLSRVAEAAEQANRQRTNLNGSSAAELAEGGADTNPEDRSVVAEQNLTEDQAVSENYISPPSSYFEDKKLA